MSADKYLEKFARQEGVRNPADIYDQPTFEEIRAEVKNVYPNVTELLDEKKLSAELKVCLNRTREFCSELSENFRLRFLSLLEKYRNERRPISQKIVDYLLEKNFNLPQFAIAHDAKATEMLLDFGLHPEIGDQKLLLSFQLPKPLAQFWRKGGANSWGYGSKDMEDRVIEWGHFYRELMGEVWHMQGYYENEKGLDFYRLNDVGEHDPKKFYYVWEMSKWE